MWFDLIKDLFQIMVNVVVFFYLWSYRVKSYFEFYVDKIDEIGFYFFRFFRLFL